MENVRKSRLASSHKRLVNGYEKIRNSKAVQTLLFPVNSMWFIAFPFVLALLSNMLSWEIPIYIIVGVAACFITLFNRDTKPVIPFFIAMYYGTSRPNSPILTKEGIYQTPWCVGIMIAIVVCAVICFILRIILTGEHKNFRFRNMNMSIGLLLFGASLLLGGIFSYNMSMKNLFMGGLYFVSFAFIYLYFKPTINWKENGTRYLAYCMFAMSVLICIELLWIFFTVPETIVDGIINKGVVLTGWGIQNNIGAMIVLGFPFCFYLAVKERHGWIFFTSANLMYALTFFTQSRNAIFIGAAVVVVGWLMSCMLAKRKMQLAVSLCITIAAVSTILVIYRDYLGQLFKFMIELGIDDNDRGRLYAEALRLYRTRPVFGVGYFMDPAFEVYDMIVPGKYHNMFLQILASTGTVGMAAFIFHLYEIVRVSVRRFNTNTLFIIFGIITLYALSQLDNHFFNVGPGLIYAAMLCFLEGDLTNSEIIARPQIEASPQIKTADSNI